MMMVNCSVQYSVSVQSYRMNYNRLLTPAGALGSIRMETRSSYKYFYVQFAYLGNVSNKKPTFTTGYKRTLMMTSIDQHKSLHSVIESWKVLSPGLHK